MNWLHYLLEANLYLAIFYGFYRQFLHNETFYSLNRYYLIATTLIAFALPLLQIGYLNQLLVGYQHQDPIYVAPELTEIRIKNAKIFDFEQIITGVYALTATAFLARLTYSLYKVLLLAIRSKKRKEGDIVYIELHNSQTAFSFFNLLFINPLIVEKATIIKHEMVHIRQRHSIDILFFEFVQILNWFNPISFLIKKDIKLLHEYLADHLTTRSGVQKHDYAMFLIQNSFGSIPCQLTSQIFNPSILKRRINMLNKQKSVGRTRLRLLYVLPVTGLMLCASTLAFTKEYTIIDLYALKGGPLESAVQQATPKEKKYFFIKGSEKRVLIINGKKLNRKGVITIEGFDEMTTLNGKTAIERYGNIGANGAVEFNGANTLATSKFPPPIVTRDLPPPPGPPAPPAPPAPLKQFKPGEIKFPPQQQEKKHKTGKVIKFPPPIVTKDVPETEVQPSEPTAPKKAENLKLSSVKSDVFEAVTTTEGTRSKPVKKTGEEYNFVAVPAVQHNQNKSSEIRINVDNEVTKAFAGEIEKVRLKSDTKSEKGDVIRIETQTVPAKSIKKE